MPLIALVLAFGVSWASAAPPPGRGEVHPVRTVEAVDLDRYAGDWFEIARYPNRFQRGCAGDVTASYSRRDDGRIDVSNRCRTADGAISAHGIARVADRKTRAKLKVRFAPGFLSFLPFVWGDYWVIGLGEDYSWAVVGSPDRKYLWILSRTPVLDPASYADALEAAHANGFDPDRLVKTSQSDRAGRDRDTP
jgi:apolipoprotein D and lipocalin family protein